MTKDNIFSFSLFDLIFHLVFFIIIFIAVYYYCKNTLYKDRTKEFAGIRQLRGFAATFLGPLVSALIYTFGPFSSVKSLFFLGILSFVICVSLCPFNEVVGKKGERNSDLSMGKFIMLAALIIPSTMLYLMLLFLLNNFSISF